MALAAVLLGLVVVIWTYFLWSRRKYYAFALKMPGPLGFPIIGIAHKIYKMEEILYAFPKVTAKYNTKTYFSWLGPYPLLYTIEPKIAEIVLNSSNCINKSKIYDVFEDAVGVGLLTNKSPIWNHHRKLLNPAFNHKVLLSFFPQFNKQSRDLCEELDKVVGCGEVNLRELTFSLALKTSVATTMGYDLSTNHNSSYIKDFESLLQLTADRMLKPWLRANFIYKRLNRYKYFLESKNNLMSFVKQIVNNKIKLLESEAKNKESNLTKDSPDIKRENNIFIDQAIAIHQRNELTLNNVIIESNLVVLAATETSGTVMFSTLMYLAMHPECQQKAFEEIDTVLPNEESDVSFEDFKSLKYLDMCINETLRHSPGFPLIARDCSKDTPIAKDLVMPKGTQIVIDIFNMQRDKDIWGPTADTFNPDHFLPANVVKRSGYAFLPFSKGQRNCLGWQYAKMILRVALAQVLRRYSFTTKYKFKDLRFQENVALKYVQLPLLEVHRRSK